MPRLVAFGAGLVFAVGLGISGMANPQKVLAFLDVTGVWDPSLALVMVSAIAVHATFVRIAARRTRPVYGERFVLSTKRGVDRRLLAGAALFGVGWGAAGYCPGPALVALAGGSAAAILFVATMVLGIVAYQWWPRALLPAPRGHATDG